MTKKKPLIKVESFGRYSNWERGSRQLPKVLEFTSTIEALEGNEFGMVIKIIGGKGIRLDYCIRHPAFRDSKGKAEPDFTGEYYVNTNQCDFYIGDCIWPPIEDKVGQWEVYVYFEGKEIACQKFNVVFPEDI